VRQQWWEHAIPLAPLHWDECLLAGLSDAELDRYFDGLVIEPLTSKTMVDPVQLREEIEQVRRNGYSTTVDQLDYGITALAVPIRALDGRTIAALNTSGYSGMVDADFLVANRLPELRATASRIANALTRYPMLVSIIGS
jgi:IclR family pca regulon transcriptional regulator